MALFLCFTTHNFFLKQILFLCRLWFSKNSKRKVGEKVTAKSATTTSLTTAKNQSTLNPALNRKKTNQNTFNHIFLVKFILFNYNMAKYQKFRENEVEIRRRLKSARSLWVNPSNAFCAETCGWRGFSTFLRWMSRVFFKPDLMFWIRWFHNLFERMRLKRKKDFYSH